MDGAPTAGGARGSPAGLIVGLLLGSLGMGFGAVIALYFALRARTDVWPPPGAPHLPTGLWLSTALVLAASGTMFAAVRAARTGQAAGLRAALAGTLLLALAFLVSQVVNWGVGFAARLPAATTAPVPEGLPPGAAPPSARLYAVLFYLLTGLHAVHIVGGLVPLGIVLRRALRGTYTPARHGGVRLCALYWHFVAVVWLVVFGVLWLTQ